VPYNILNIGDYGIALVGPAVYTLEVDSLVASLYQLFDNKTAVVPCTAVNYYLFIRGDRRKYLFQSCVIVLKYFS